MLIETDPIRARVKHAIAGLLASYSGTTLEAYRLDLSGWIGWLDVAFLVQAGLCGGRDHALACLLALNGLRISEALGADIVNLDFNRGHRTLFIHRKGNKTATIPLSPRTARALDLYIGERESVPIFMNHDGTSRLDRHAPARIVRRLTKAAGIDKRISPHSLRHTSSPRRSTQGFLCVTCGRRRRTRTRERRCATTEDENRSIATPPTSCPPSSLAPAADQRRPRSQPIHMALSDAGSRVACRTEVEPAIIARDTWADTKRSWRRTCGCCWPWRCLDFKQG